MTGDEFADLRFVPAGAAYQRGVIYDRTNGHAFVESDQLVDLEGWR